MTWPFWRHLALLIAAIALPLGVLLAYKLHELAQAQYRDAERITQGLAENQATRIRSLFENTQRIAALIAERPQVRKLDRRNCDPLIRDLLHLPQLVQNVSVLDPERRFICSALQPANTAPARPHSGFTRALNGLPGLSGPVRGAIDQRWIIAAAHPVTGDDGKVAGVVTVTIDLKRLGTEISSDAIWPGARSTIIDPEGVVVARSNGGDQWIGQAVAGMPAVKTAATSQKPETNTGIDGVERIYAAATINDHGWKVITGIPVETLLARERTETRHDLLFIGLIITLFAATASGLARQLASPVRNMSIALRRIETGDRDARVPEKGPREIAELAQRFNHALDHLRNTERASALLAAIVESSNDAIFSRDPEGLITSWNSAATRMFGWTAQEAIGKPAQLISPPDRAGNFAHLLERVLRGEVVPPYDTERQRKDGSRFHAQVSLSGIKDDAGRVTGVSTTVRDITERRRAEENLRALAMRLSQVEESERRNIHRELHDQIGACLAALKIDLDLLKKQLPPDDDKAARRLEQMRQMAGETIRRIRDVMADLRPPGLDDYGLLAALRSHAEDHAERMGVPVTVSGEDIKPRLLSAVETALFRIAQEALNNVAKHAQAKNVVITITMTQNLLTLSVSDDGIGFNPKNRDSAHRHWGLDTMRERALGIGADLMIESAPGQGTRVEVRLLTGKGRT